MTSTFWMRIIRLFLQPPAEWKVIHQETSPYGELFRSYILPLSLIPFLSSLPSAFMQAGLIALPLNLIFFGASLLFIHIVTIIIETLSNSMGAQCGRESAAKLAAYSITPIYIFLAFAPLIGWFLAVSFPCSAILYSLGASEILPFSGAKKVRFILATILLAFASLLFLNLFVIGVMGMLFGA